jgi:hypothetical protein
MIKIIPLPGDRWIEQTFDENDNEIYFLNSDGYWEKREWEDGKCVYFENSDGKIANRQQMKEHYEFLEKTNQQYSIWRAI